VTQRIVYATLLLIGIVSGVSWYMEHRPAPLTVDQAVAHEQTAVATLAAAKAETVFVAEKAVAAAARVEYRAVTVERRIHDTVWVASALAKADTVIQLDALALTAADSVIGSQQRVASSLRTELSLALVPHPAPRLALVASALYDPLAAIPAASADVSLRIIGSLSLMVRGEQRFTPGEKPRLYAGLSVRL
jgi:hypothetical protein